MSTAKQRTLESQWISNFRRENGRWKIELADRVLEFNGVTDAMRDAFRERESEKHFYDELVRLTVLDGFTLQDGLDIPPHLPDIEFVIEALRAKLGISERLFHVGSGFSHPCPRLPHQHFTVSTITRHVSFVDSDTGDFFELNRWTFDLYRPIRVQVNLDKRRDFPTNDPWKWTVHVRHDASTRVEPLLDALRELDFTPIEEVSPLPS
ncbi:MAG: hypothetical protein JNM17_28545 [Archangium sp.]|nr:hypothetical protein [Archangium sp.]